MKLKNNISSPTIEQKERPYFVLLVGDFCLETRQQGYSNFSFLFNFQYDTDTIEKYAILILWSVV